MKIVNVSMKEQRRYLPVKGWESVEKALHAFATGTHRSARATESVTLKDIAEAHGANGGMAVGLFLLGGALSNRSSLVDELLKEAKSAIDAGHSFRRSYDYDGMGTPFFKSDVSIDILDRSADMFAIGINAAYVGDKPEEELAAYFGIPRTLISAQSIIETEPTKDGRFQFDFEQLVRKLDPVLHTHKLAGRTIVQALRATDPDRTPYFTLYQDDALVVRIGLGRTGYRIEYNRSTGKKTDLWAANDAVLKGPLDRDYSSKDPEAKAAPTLLITVASSKKDRWGAGVHMWRPEQQEAAIELSVKIAAALM